MNCFYCKKKLSANRVLKYFCEESCRKKYIEEPLHTHPTGNYGFFRSFWKDWCKGIQSNTIEHRHWEEFEPDYDEQLAQDSLL